jgi:hypothetical protein
MSKNTQTNRTNRSLYNIIMIRVYIGVDYRMRCVGFFEISGYWSIKIRYIK